MMIALLYIIQHLVNIYTYVSLFMVRQYIQIIHEIIYILYMLQNP